MDDCGGGEDAPLIVNHRTLDPPTLDPFAWGIRILIPRVRNSHARIASP